jgi:hypothetical protein
LVSIASSIRRESDGDALNTTQILAADAICSSVDVTHDALMTLYSERFAEQIELVDTSTIPESWPNG